MRYRGKFKLILKLVSISILLVLTYLPSSYGKNSNLSANSIKENLRAKIQKHKSSALDLKVFLDAKLSGEKPSVESAQVYFSDFEVSSEGELSLNKQPIHVDDEPIAEISGESDEELIQDLQDLAQMNSSTNEEGTSSKPAQSAVVASSGSSSNKSSNSSSNKTSQDRSSADTAPRGDGPKKAPQESSDNPKAPAEVASANFSNNDAPTSPAPSSTAVVSNDRNEGTEKNTDSDDDIAVDSGESSTEEETTEVASVSGSITPTSDLSRESDSLEPVKINPPSIEETVTGVTANNEAPDSDAYFLWSESTVATSTKINTGKDQIYLAAISNINSAIEVNSVTGLGLKWHRLHSLCSTNGSYNMEIWYAVGTPDSAGQVHASFTSTINLAQIVVHRISGGDVSAPFGNHIIANNLGFRESAGCGGAPLAGGLYAKAKITDTNAIGIVFVGLDQIKNEQKMERASVVNNFQSSSNSGDLTVGYNWFLPSNSEFTFEIHSAKDANWNFFAVSISPLY